MGKLAPADFGVIFDLAAIERELRSEEAYARKGHTARTLVREDGLREVLIAMRAGSRIAAHAADDTISIQTLTGQLCVQLPRLARQREGRIVDLPIGRLLVLEPGYNHAIEATADSALLITFVRKDKGWRLDTVGSRTPATCYDALAAFYGCASGQAGIT